MSTIPPHYREELDHFINILYSLMSYKRDGTVDVERIYRSFNLLSKEDKELLTELPSSRTIKILKALLVNQDFIITLVTGIIDFRTYRGNIFNFWNGGEKKYTEEEVINEIRNIVKNSFLCNSRGKLQDSDINPTNDPLILQRNINWVRSTLRQFVRDWAEEGKLERNQCFTPLLEALKRRVPIEDPDNPPVILCPGSGLGRLPFEVTKLGYCSMGNEFSFFMLIGSQFIINHVMRPKSFKIYPYCLDTSNRIFMDDHLKAILIPDESPSTSQIKEGRFSIFAGEFMEIYEDYHSHFDGILTSFFLDTAKNIIAYIRTIAKILKKGALWANIGPLLYHYADLAHNSIELPWEEVKQIISKWFTIEKIEIREANYTSNPLSMMKTQYKCIFFEAIRNDTPVTGRSNVF